MKQVICYPRGFLSSTIAAGALALAVTGFGPVALAQPSGLVPLRSILWHGVAGPQGKYSGAITDVLVEMPSGRILYIAVNPADLFRSPRLLPSQALARLPNGDFRSHLSLDQWLHAPVLDLTGQRVEQFNGQADQIVAVQAPAWTPGRSDRARGRRSVAAPIETMGFPQFVSLQTLIGAAAATTGHEELGTVSGFVADWPHHRINYAIVTAANTPAAPNAPSFAVPLALLSPGAGSQPVVVNAPSDAFRAAPQVSLNRAASLQHPEQIFRLPARTGFANR